MLDFAMVALFGLALIPVLAVTRGRMHTTVFYWSVAGVILWATGFALVAGEAHPSFTLLAHSAGPLSASLFLLGALRLAGRPNLRRIAVAGMLGALLVGFAYRALGRPAAGAIQIAISLPMLGYSAWIVIDNAVRRRAALVEKLLGGTIAGLAVLTAADIAIRIFGEANEILFSAWATLVFAIAFLLLASLTSRASRRAKRLTSELQAQSQATDVERRTLLALIEALPLGVTLTDPEGRIRYMHTPTSPVFGRDRNRDWEGRPVAELLDTIEDRIAPADREAFRAGLAQEGSQRPAMPALEIVLDGGNRIIEVESRPVVDAQESALGRLWIAQDVTEARQFAERLGQIERMEAVGTLAGGIAHDFNNQLTAILGNLDFLTTSSLDEQERREAVQAVEKAAVHCSELTQSLLTFAHRRAPKRDSLLVGDLVRDVADLLRPGLPAGAHLEEHVAPGTGSILAEAADLRRVLINLGINARDAVSGTGTIRLEARRVKGPAGEQIELIVADDGLGMDEETRRRIFDPFFTTKEPGSGTGLGLSVVYGIVQNHGASIEVESALGQGSIFRLLWPVGAPLQPVRSDSRAKRIERPEKPLRGETILLADDDDDVRSAIRGMLGRAGFNVLEAADGPSAVTCFHDHAAEIDLVLLDLAMPGCNGLEVLAQIQQVAPDTPTLLMSGNPDAFIDHEHFEASQLLMKPFRSSVLVERLRDVLGRTSPPT